MDYGYQYVVAGFELRGGVRLLSLIVVSAGGRNSEQKGANSSTRQSSECG
jgi:hypothetical protein